MATRSRSRAVWAVALVLFSACSAVAAPRGNAAAGQVLFEKKCIGCHTVERLAGLGDLVTNDMRKIKPRMETLGLLWDDEVAHLRAYLNSVPAAAPHGQ